MIESLMFYNIFNSKLGKVTIATDGEYITELHLETDKYFHEIPKDWTLDTQNQLLENTHQQMDKYLSGELKIFDLPVSFHGTDFQKEVWKSLKDIPFGKTVTYRDIAEKIHKPKSVRAVGTAIGRNPICIVVPCHRVIGTNGSLTGYAAGLDVKEKLLKLESSKDTK